MELALCLKVVTELYHTGARSSSRKDDNRSQGQTTTQKHALAGILQVGGTERGEILERKMTDDSYTIDKAMGSALQ